jgi:Protein of unknown function (DUF2934)
MRETTHAIDVNAPLRAVYSLWRRVSALHGKRRRSPTRWPKESFLESHDRRDSEGVAAPTQEQVARRAYELYIEGQVPGHEREDWLEAEKALSEEYSADRLAQRPD